jgi:crossover junction endodeoxyribonuclease RusA
MPIEIHLPLPDRRLSPNARTHWRPKAAATKQYRELARGLATCARGATYEPLPMRAALCRVTYRVADRRRRDRDNLLAMLKAAFDGVADAGIVRDDSDITYAPVQVEVVGRGGQTGVVLSIEAV